MKSEMAFTLKSYDFNTDVLRELEDNALFKNLWPVVYIISDENIKKLYVGETTDTLSRISTHLKHPDKKLLTVLHFISSTRFNKSATLDIESNLIKYLSGDGKFKLINGNLGLANHNYFQKKEVYWDIFTSIWDSLRAEGISLHPLNQIDNSDLFKYSPYKSLSLDQKKGLAAIIRGLLNDNNSSVIVEGGAGTGKTILAVFLFKLIHTEPENFNFKDFGEEESEFLDLTLELRKKYVDPKMALVVPMASFRNTLKKVFKNVHGLNSNMVVGPSEIVNSKFDIIVVDESHRLRRRVNLGTYFKAFDDACKKLSLDASTTSELDWILQQSKKSIFFYDQNQSIKPSDVKGEEFTALKFKNSTQIEYLKSQFRVKGGNDYIRYVNRLLNCSLEPQQEKFNSPKYEFLLFSSLAQMVTEIKKKNTESGLARLIAGYSWEWVSKKDPQRFDIIIDGIELRWNSVSNDWVNSETSISEVGCIHTTQGYDLNYAGVIFGHEITYDETTNEIKIIKDNYKDKNGKNSIKDEEELKNFVLNIYSTILLRGIKGTYVYACDPKLHTYLKKHLEAFNIDNARLPLLKPVSLEIERSVPLYNLRAAAGDFSNSQIVDESDWISIPPKYKSTKELFACKVVGESMNKVIPNGSICLFRKYSGGSRNGRIVLVQHASIQDPDFGAGYTVKEYHSSKKSNSENWTHESISLHPLSSDPTFMPITLNNDELDSLKVIGLFECVLQDVNSSNH